MKVPPPAVPKESTTGLSEIQENGMEPLPSRRCCLALASWVTQAESDEVLIKVDEQYHGRHLFWLPQNQPARVLGIPFLELHVLDFPDYGFS